MLNTSPVVVVTEFRRDENPTVFNGVGRLRPSRQAGAEADGHIRLYNHGRFNGCVAGCPKSNYFLIDHIPHSRQAVIE